MAVTRLGLGAYPVSRVDLTFNPAIVEAMSALDTTDALVILVGSIAETASAVDTVDAVNNIFDDAIAETATASDDVDIVGVFDESIVEITSITISHGRSTTRLGLGGYPIAALYSVTIGAIDTVGAQLIASDAIVETMHAVDTVDSHLLGGIIYQHEIGNDAAGLPLVSSFRTGFFYLDEGENFVVVDEVLPDFKFAFQGAPPNAQIQMTFFVVNYPGDTPLVYGPYTVTATTQSFFTRFRVRQMAIEVSSSDLGSFWRLGKVRFRFAPSGRR